MPEGAAQGLERFVQAQARQYADAIAELRAGRKRTHWIWFVLPQLRALGRSGTARVYGLENLAEAAAFWRHPTLGTRLRECVDAMLSIEGRSAAEVLGEVDAMKFRSCLTLFLAVAPDEHRLRAALDRYYAGRPDPLTLGVLQGRADAG
jgi:uncharacterized protein (DUF1810 family)